MWTLFAFDIFFGALVSSDYTILILFVFSCLIVALLSFPLRCHAVVLVFVFLFHIETKAALACWNVPRSQCLN